MALSIQSGACSSGVPTIATNLTVATVERLNDSTLRVWYTLPVDLGADKADSSFAYSISGPESVSVARATKSSSDAKAIDLYLSTNLSAGQWTIVFSSPNITSGSIVLPSNTSYIFDIADVNQEAPGLETKDNLTRKLFNPAFVGKKNWEGLIGTLEDNRRTLSAFTQKVFDQHFISTASGKYLAVRTSNHGVLRPSALGLADESFRKLAISVINQKLTLNAGLSLIEILYGVEATRANLISLNAEPFKLFDQATLTLQIDGEALPITFSWADFGNTLAATAEEVCFILNKRFLEFGCTAFASPWVNFQNSKTYIRIYSGTIGLRSSIAVLKGTSRPIFNFGDKLFGT